MPNLNYMTNTEVDFEELRNRVSDLEQALQDTQSDFNKYRENTDRIIKAMGNLLHKISDKLSVKTQP